MRRGDGARWILGLSVLMIACSEAADRDDDDDDDGFTPPDIAGAYLAELEEPAGCEEHDVPLDWAWGPLLVTGTGVALTFDFDGLALSGSVDPSFTWVIADSGTIAGWTLDVDGIGLAYIQRDLWVLEGDVTVEASDPGGPICTLTGVLVAREQEE